MGTRKNHLNETGDSSIEHTKQFFKLNDKKIFITYAYNFCLSGPVHKKYALEPDPFMLLL